jgi:hypothetical protein
MACMFVIDQKLNIEQLIAHYEAFDAPLHFKFPILHPLISSNNKMYESGVLQNDDL